MAYTTIDDPSAYFTITLYTGNATDNRAITNSANAGDFQPDWLWYKERSSTSEHRSFDSSRGASKRIEPNNTNQEATDTSNHKSFDSNGFTVGTSGSTNANGDTYVAWQWKANGGTATGSFNESGNNPGVSFQANTTAGFSICTYTGTGGNGSFAHGLGVIPAMFIIKRRSGTEDWAVYHHQNTSAPETDHLLLNTTDATSDSDTRFQDTAPTSASIYIGNNAVVNADASTYVCYAFAQIKGYSRFGSYTGNANADGTFVYTGFKPAWLLIKRTDSSGNWVLIDSKRDAFNQAGLDLNPDSNAAENSSTSYYGIDLLSNGFKLRNGNAETNGDGTTNVYMAFAESPFTSSEGVPTTAR